MDPETRMGWTCPCTNVAWMLQPLVKSSIDYGALKKRTSRILSSSQYHWPWSVYCAAVWLYICTKPRKNPHDTHIFFADAYHIRVNMWTHTVYIYILIILYLSTFKNTCPTLKCLYTSLPLYNLQTKDVCHGLAVMELARLRSALGEGFRLPPTRPHGWDWGLPYQAVPKVRVWRAEHRTLFLMGSHFLNSEEYFIHQWFFKFSMALPTKNLGFLTSL